MGAYLVLALPLCFLALVAGMGALENLRMIGSEILGAARDVSNSPGAAPLWAAARQGSKEFSQNLLPAFPDSARPIEEPGAMGNPTAALVTEQIRGDKAPDKQPELDLER